MQVSHGELDDDPKLRWQQDKPRTDPDYRDNQHDAIGKPPVPPHHKKPRQPKLPWVEA